MPELPEVEVVRSGLADALIGSRITGVEVRDLRALKRHRPVSHLDDGAIRGVAADFEHRLKGVRLLAPARRGKFLWIPLWEGTEGSDECSPHVALLAHLGMSGQLLVRHPEQPDARHVRVRLWVESAEFGELRLDFVDQRLFGSLAVDRLQATLDSAPGGHGNALSTVPQQAAHIARDPLDPVFNDHEFVTELNRRSMAIKKVLLDQRFVSGIGNIYADEALWLARIHPETPATSVSVIKAKRLLNAVRGVFAKALEEGGTSFDRLYVNVNGESGYFAHSLNAYGREGEPCRRCGTVIRRVAFMNRSSRFCSRCQRRR